MKIMFICGSIEPGCDGVGDYTRRLGGEMIRLGCSVSILALSDRYVQLDYEEEIQLISNVEILTYRFSSNLPWSKKMVESAKIVNQLNPDWISLQYVPYSFHSRGLHFGLAKKLKKISGARNFQIMFHELWVGNNSVKNKIITLFQKCLIYFLVKNLNPKTIHTHLPTYYNNLANLGIIVKPLPLFSNIDVFSKISYKQSNIFRIAFFSQVKSDKIIIDFLSQLRKQVLENAQVLEIILIGGSATQMRNHGAVIERIEGFQNVVKYTGFMIEEEISKIIQSCNLGITPMPLHTLGKSSSVAVFLVHGIPVAVPYQEHKYKYKPFFNEEIVNALVLEPRLDKISLESVLKVKYMLSLKKIGKVFLQDLVD